ncbi:MAG: hypothetical protein OXO52_02720 [Rhodospirillales bacterium]|nr:hypothetical protein [Rhodospirillales bacterium]MDE0378579.1 hypothetical protein [Rhodospirillales bacterium]
MAAFPFPNFPTYQQYADWLGGNGIRVEFDVNEWGRYMLASHADGSRHTIERHLEPKTPLVPSTVERIDLRLGVVSPWNPLSKTQQEAADD